MTINDNVNGILSEYQKGEKPKAIARKYKIEVKEIVTVLRDKGYKVPWKMFGSGNIVEAIKKYEEKVIKEKGKLGQEDIERIERAKKAAILENEWRNYGNIRQVLDEMITDYIKGKEK